MGPAFAKWGNIAVIFGGAGKDTQFNDLFLLDPGISETVVFDLTLPANQTWTKIERPGAPSPRTGSSAAVVGDLLLVFGGFSSELGWVDELYALDLSNPSGSWSLVESPGPQPRDKAGLVSVGPDLYLFGGFGPLPEDSEDPFAEEEEGEREDSEESGPSTKFTWFSDLWRFDTANLKWTRLPLSGEVPPPRAAFGFAANPQGLFIVGGRDSEGRTNVVFQIDFDGNCRVLTPAGARPAPRSFHTLSSLNDTFLILFGGRGIKDDHFCDIHLLDLASNRWLQPKAETDISRRGFHR